jgi:hypothetical protein
MSVPEYSVKKTPEYCIKKSPEEAQKEMEELTKRELEKLAKTISERPELLKPKYLESDDDTESEYSDSDCSCSSSDSSSTDRPTTLTVYQKELEIDKLNTKNHFKTLEITNLMCEKSKLENEIKELRKNYDDSIKFIQFVKKVVELKENHNLPDSTVFLSDNMESLSTKLVKLRNSYDSALDDMKKLRELIQNQDELTKKYFTKELANIQSTLDADYKKKFEQIQSLMEKIVSDKKVGMFVVGIVFPLVVGYVVFHLSNYYLNSEF